MRKLLPPLLTAFLLAVMLVGTIWVQYPVTEGLLVRAFGGLLVVCGLFLSIAAKRQFTKANTNVDTFESPTKLVTSGWFHFSRNPMYLGLLMLLIGVALVLNNAWALLGSLAFFAAAAFWYIPFEERDALATFGDPYRKYCESVRRWL